MPRIQWEEHRLSVSGMVDKPTTFTMDDLLAMPARELPVTLVCAGNRRKEENLVKQTIGFNWGAAGVSTSVWKGVLLREVLLACGVKTPAEEAHVVRALRRRLHAAREQHLAQRAHADAARDDEADAGVELGAWQLEWKKTQDDAARVLKIGRASCRERV